jgi:hypothetical protein
MNSISTRHVVIGAIAAPFWPSEPMWLGLSFRLLFAKSCLLLYARFSIVEPPGISNGVVKRYSEMVLSSLCARRTRSIE